MKKLLQVLVVFAFVFSCTKDTFEEPKVDDTNPRIAADQFDNSHLGVYKGLFTTADGLTRGSVVVTLSPTNEGIAQITLSSGEMIELKSSRVKLSVDNTVSNLRFSSAGLSEIDATLEFSVEGDGLNPMISAVSFDNKDSDILIAKNLSRAPLTPITGTYVREAGGGSFPTTGRTWNIMSIGAGNTQTFATQIAFGGTVYNTPAANNVQSGCATAAGYTTCTIAGSATVSGFAVTWSGSHKYSAGNAANEPQCSEVFGGTWSAPSYGGSIGTFVSDTTCTVPAVVNDLCTGAISVGAGTYNGSTANATSTGNPGTCTTALNTGPGVWYSYNSGTDYKSVTVNTFGTAFDTKLGVLSGSCGALTCILGNDDAASGGLQSEVVFSAVPGVTYYFYVTGFQLQSGAYTLNVSDVVVPPPPANDLCANATAIACGGTVSGTTNGSTTAGTLATCTTSLNTSGGVWHTFSTPTTKSVTVNTVGSAYDTKLGVFRGTCGALVCVAGNDDGPTGVTPQSQVVFTAAANTTYYFYVTGFSTNTGAYTLNVTCADPPPGSVFTLTPACTEYVVDNGTSSANYGANRNDVYTLDAGAGNVISLPFTVFNTEAGWDSMRLYNGQVVGTNEITSVNGRVILVNAGTPSRTGFNGTGTGANSLQGQTVVSSGRYLTITFRSDGSFQFAGFLAQVNCIPARTADDSHIRTSATFMPAASSISARKVYTTEVMSESEMLIEKDRKKQEAFERESLDYEARKMQNYNNKN